MIYLEICGNKGEGVANSVENIIRTLLIAPDTKQVILIDDACGIIYELKLSEFRMGTAESEDKLQKMLTARYPEKVVYIMPIVDMNVSECVNEVMQKISKNRKTNCHEKVYCVYVKWSI